MGARAFAASVIIAGFWIGERTAAAQDASTLAARRELLDQATQARHAGNHREALDLATRAGQLEMTPSVRGFVAEEQNSLAMYVEALGNADLCVREAERDPALRNRDTIIAACRDLLATVRPHVGHVTIQVAATAPTDLRITVNGVVLDRALYGVAYGVNPGTITVEATASGYHPFRSEVTVAAQASANVPLAMERETASTASPSPAASTARPASSPLPIIVAGVGALGVVAGVVMIAVQQSLVGGFESSYCNFPTSTDCRMTPESQSALSTMQTLNTGGYVALAAGGVLLVAGVLWKFISPRSSHARERARIDVAPTAGGLILTFGGAL